MCWPKRRAIWPFRRPRRWMPTFTRSETHGSAERSGVRSRLSGRQRGDLCDRAHRTLLHCTGTTLASRAYRAGIPSAIPQESLCNRRFLPSPQPSPCKGEGGEGASPQPSPCKGEGAIIPQELLWLCTRNDASTLAVDASTLDAMRSAHRTRMETRGVSTSAVVGGEVASLKGIRISMTAPHSKQAPLTVALLGPIEVRIHGRPWPRTHSPKSLWILALLILHHDRAVQRDWLAETLWPDSSPQQALANLRVNLSHLRKALGDEQARLQSPTPQTLRLDLAGAEVDLLTFDAAIKRGGPRALKEAVALYRP